MQAIKTAILLFTLYFLVFSVQGQRLSLYGILRDTLQKRSCPETAIVLMMADSSLVRFTRSKKDGSFLLETKMVPGNYYLLFTHPDYEPLYRAVLVRDTVSINFGVVAMSPKADNLAAVIVRPNALPPRMKGDTVEYNTENIRMQPNAVVEELLRRLPGLQIDASGNITFNGEKIQHLLVDGEDIFGSDPSIVSRNFDAGKIARVQVLDRKSEQTLFTGIDDGTRTKTLNLVLKESARNSYFGKIEAGGNVQGYYNANALGAAFRGKEQLTALALASNTGTTSINGNSGGAGGGISFVTKNADALGASAGNGIPRFAASAVHYADTRNAGEDHIKLNYQFSHFVTNPITSSETLQVQPDSIYTQKQQSQSVNQQNRHWVFALFQRTPNVRTAFGVALYCGNIDGQNRFSSYGNSAFNDIPVNSSHRTIDDRFNQFSIGTNGSWRMRIGERAGRTVSVVAGFSKVNNVTNGFLYSANQFFQPDGSLNTKDTTDQRKTISNHPFDLNATVNYTEPLWKGAQLGLSYTVFFTADNPLQETFSKGNGKYQELIDSLSSRLKSGQINQNVTLTLQGNTGRLAYTIINSLVNYGYRQRDLAFDSLTRLNYSTWTPRALFNYTVNPALNLAFDYSTAILQPSVQQLQSVTNNNDPLHISLGNPKLKPETSQNFRFDIHRFRKSVINFSLNMVLTTNSISNRTTTDSLGRQVSQPLNVNGSHSAGFNFSLSKKILGFETGIQFNGNYNRTKNYINADLSDNDTYSAGGGLILNRYLQGKYALQINANLSHFDAVSSINTGSSMHYWIQTHSGSLTLYLLRNFEINSNAAFTWQQKTSALASNVSVLLWNAYFSRNFLQNKLVIKVLFNNILNQNAGISRTNVFNITTQNSTNILGRYYMVSAIYHFDKKLKK